MSALLYFAYGSNMSFRQLNRRCASAEFLCAAQLRDYRLAFTRRSQARRCGVLDVVPAPGEVVHGGVFRIAHCELELLDVAEAVSSGGYRRITVDLQSTATGEFLPGVTTYEVVSKRLREVPPSREYLETVLTGARDCGLPEDYIERLVGYAFC